LQPQSHYYCARFFAVAHGDCRSELHGYQLAKRLAVLGCAEERRGREVHEGKEAIVVVGVLRERRGMARVERDVKLLVIVGCK
jgi:hypothetical protein